MVKDKVLDRLEAEAKVADADEEELTIAVESDIEEKESEVEELQEEVSEKEAKVEELQEEVSEKESEVEELQEEVQVVVDKYATELAEHSSVMDESDYKTKFGVSELREKYEALEEELEEEADPRPRGGDEGPHVQSGNGDVAGEEAEEASEAELSREQEKAAEVFEKRGGVWAEHAKDMKTEE